MTRFVKRWPELLLGSNSNLAETLQVDTVTLRFSDEETERGYEEHLIESRRKCLMQRFFFSVGLYTVAMILLWIGCSNVSDALVGSAIILFPLLMWICAFGFNKYVKLERAAIEISSRKYYHVWSYMISLIYVLQVAAISVFVVYTISVIDGFNLYQPDAIVYIVVTIICMDYMVNLHLHFRVVAPIGLLINVLYMVIVSASLPDRFDPGRLFFIVCGYVSALVLRYQKEFFHRVGYSLSIQIQPLSLATSPVQAPGIQKRMSPTELHTIVDILEEFSVKSLVNSTEILTTVPQKAFTAWSQRIARRITKFKFDFYQFAFKSFLDNDAELKFQKYCAQKLRESTQLTIPLLFLMSISIVVSRQLFYHVQTGQPEAVWLTIWCLVCAAMVYIVRTIRWQWLQMSCMIILILQSVMVFAFHYKISHQPIWRDFITLQFLGLAMLNFRFAFMLLFQQVCIILMCVNQILTSPSMPTEGPIIALEMLMLLVIYLWISYVILGVSSNLEKRLRAYYTYWSTVQPSTPLS